VNRWPLLQDCRSHREHSAPHSESDSRSHSRHPTCRFGCATGFHRRRSNHVPALEAPLATAQSRAQYAALPEHATRPRVRLHDPPTTKLDLWRPRRSRGQPSTQRWGTRAVCMEYREVEPIQSASRSPAVSRSTHQPPRREAGVRVETTPS